MGTFHFQYDVSTEKEMTYVNEEETLSRNQRCKNLLVLCRDSVRSSIETKHESHGTA